MKRFPTELLLVPVVFALDQITKAWVIANIAPGEFVYPVPALSRVFGFTLVGNTGVAFGLFPEGGALFTALTAVVVVVMAAYVFRLPPERRIMRLALALLLAGACGNLFDRLRLGYVVDFVAVGSFARFNVADSSVSLGVASLLLSWLLELRRSSSQVPGAIHEGHEDTRP